MKLLECVKTFAQKAKKSKKTIGHYVKDPLLFFGLAGVSGVAGCAYGPPDPVCSLGERYCVDNYAMICYGENSDDVNLYGLDCEKGCSEGACIDKKVKNEVVTDCKTGDTKVENSEDKVCIDGVWFK